ncbi:uncharacterized protein LOC124434119 [Xenia sp. Carnegie-2017]|uniref:uncharacterized protein LOC124434119 n=1 Tax=Xenia sp. Carnegie-2017 TaxID=2897299 RepID=UPI001F03E25E|nr:uncharacterized protein LOC124434119 [Xenia sp. Carnegie-2017]
MADKANFSTISEQSFSNKTLRNLQSVVCSQLRCDICPTMRFTSLKMYNEHIKSKKHLRKKHRKENEGSWYCEACNLSLPNDNEWTKHLVGKRHDKSMKAMAIKEYPRSCVLTPEEISLLDEVFIVEDDSE